MEVGLSPVGTKFHGKTAAGVERERSVETTRHQPEDFLEEENSWNRAMRMPDGPSRELPQQQQRQSPDTDWPISLSLHALFGDLVL